MTVMTSGTRTATGRSIRHDSVANVGWNVLKTMLGMSDRRRNRVYVYPRRDGHFGVMCPCCDVTWVVESTDAGEAGTFAHEHVAAHRRAAELLS